jgi:glycyl-tRNA synthetase
MKKSLEEKNLKKEEKEDLFSKIISLCKRRGFVFPSSEIYGGFSSSYDFGPLGVEMKNNIKRVWWDEMTKKHFDIVGLDSAILMNPKIWEASGHLTSGFADELVECKNCHKRFRLDEVLKNVCPECQGEITKPRKFNLMMKSYVGPVEEKASLVYLRAETCQGIYVNFKNILTSLRLKIPFGVAQIGKAFRNEITPRDFIYRMREFEQMEMEWFCHPKEADEYFEFFRE